MIRWYDWLVAFFAADLMVWFMMWGITASTWWEPMLGGLAAGTVWQFWKTDYCNFRKKIEKSS